MTDQKIWGHESVDQPVMEVYRIEIDGTVQLVISDIPMPNGKAISHDQNILYVSCNFEGNEKDKPLMWIDRFTLNENGDAAAPEEFIKYPDSSGVRWNRY